MHGFLRMVEDLVRTKEDSFPALRGICLRHIRIRRAGPDGKQERVYVTAAMEACVELVGLARHRRVDIALTDVSDPICVCPVCPFDKNVIDEPHLGCGSYYSYKGKTMEEC